MLFPSLYSGVYMPNKRIAMHKIHEKAFEVGLSFRQISHAQMSARCHPENAQNDSEAAGISATSGRNVRTCRLLYPESEVVLRLEDPDWAEIHMELRKRRHLPPAVGVKYCQRMPVRAYSYRNSAAATRPVPVTETLHAPAASCR